MSGIAHQQLDAIHSMLTAGQRSLRVERHSLVLWGLGGGALIALSNTILTPAQFPALGQRALAWLILLAVVLGGIAYLDLRLTRAAKATRDETWSFIHRQVLKVLWLMMAMGALLTFATLYFGGAYLLLPSWLVLLGMAIFVHGLFSEEMLEWAGIAIILIGVLCLAFQLPFDTAKWVAGSVFGVGLPSLSLALDRGRSRPLPHRLLQTVVWLLVVLAPALLHRQYVDAMVLPDGPVVALADFRRGAPAAGPAIVALPAGTEVPVKVAVSGALFGAPDLRTLPLTLAEPLELLLRDGKLTGDVRRPGGDWMSCAGARWIAIPWIKAELTQDSGPVVRASLVVDLGSAFKP